MIEGISRKYSVMDGEPHLGKQIETTITVEREEYIEAIIDAILNDCESTEDEFDVVDGSYTYSATLGDSLTQEDIDNIKKKMNEKLLDDDYGSGKDHDLIYSLLDDLIDDNWSDKFEVVEMR